MPGAPAPNGNAFARRRSAPASDAPRAQVEAEDRGDEHGVAGTDAHAPHDPGLRVGDRVPVGAPDAERRRAAGRSGRAVDVVDLAVRDAQVVAEGRHARLRVAQVLLRDHRHLRLEVLERAQVVGMKARLLPLAAVERRVVPRVARDLLEPLEDGVLALGGAASSRAAGTSSANPTAAGNRGRSAAGRSRIPSCPPVRVSGGRARRPSAAPSRRSRRAGCPAA